MKKPKFKVGDKVTYKSVKELPGGNYCYNGEDHGGFIGVIREYSQYIDSVDCYKIYVSTNGHDTYAMLESEFVEYDKSVGLAIPINTNPEKTPPFFNF